LSRMLGGTKMTDAVRASARELLEGRKAKAKGETAKRTKD
jgi:hypothetical protein